MVREGILEVAFRLRSEGGEQEPGRRTKPHTQGDTGVQWGSKFR